MFKTQLPSLTLKDWRETRDTIQKYTQMTGAIREIMNIPHPHWWHISLRISDKGLTTNPIFKDKNDSGQTFELIIDIENHHLIIESNFREAKKIKLTGQSLCALYEETCSLLSDIGITLPIDKEKFADGKSCIYDEVSAGNYWYSLKEIHRITNKFRSELSGERSPVQLWPHHFDLSMSWFSGRLIPGKDPDDAESSKEQMAFGFSTGDDTISDAYFYITAYPVPDGLHNIKAPDGSRWNTEGFQGGVMMYDEFAASDNPEEKLLNYFRVFQSEGSKLMR